MPDIKELRRILAIVEDEAKMPEGTAWNQGYWFRKQEVGEACGTAMCFAGWKVYLDGYTKYVPDANFPDAYTGAQMVNPKTGKAIEYWQVRDYARNALKLTDDDADALFNEDNDLDDLENFINDIEQESLIGEKLSAMFGTP